LPEPAKEGYIFAGWYQEENFENLINVILEVQVETLLFMPNG